jgi:hypothetical protein
MITDPFLMALRAELGAVAIGRLTPCGYTCACHGGYTCSRAEHPDEDDNRAPHVAQLEDESLVMWTGPCAPTDPE